MDTYGDGWHGGYITINGNRYCDDFKSGTHYQELIIGQRSFHGAPVARALDGSCSGFNPGDFNKMGNAMMVMMKGAEMINGVSLGSNRIGRRRYDGIPGYRDLGDGEFEIGITRSDIERMAERYIEGNSESKTWSPRRRQEALEEAQQMFRDLLRDTPDDEDEETLEAPTDKLVAPERRRVDYEDLTTLIWFTYGATAMTVGESREIAISFSNREPAVEGFTTFCRGFSLDLMAIGFEIGFTIMDRDDVEGKSQGISFGADFPGLEAGCAINLVKIGSRIAGGGFSCGVGIGMCPVTFSWGDCDTQKLG